MTAPIVAIVGAAAAGKTAVGEPLATALGAPYLSIDAARRVTADADAAWSTLLSELDARRDTVCVVESCATPDAYKELLAARRAVVVHVTAPPATRLERLIARGWSPRRAARALDDRGHSLPADFVIAGDAAPDAGTLLSAVELRLKLLAWD